MSTETMAVDREALAQWLYTELEQDDPDVPWERLHHQHVYRWRVIASQLLDHINIRDAAAVRHEAETEVANAFVAWAAKNEIAEPPLDWKWFGEIARRYSSTYSGGDR